MTREELIAAIDANIFWTDGPDEIETTDKIVDSVIALLRSDPAIPKRSYEAWTLAIADVRNRIQQLIEAAIEAASAEVDSQGIAVDDLAKHLQSSRKVKGGASFELDDRNRHKS